MTILLSDSMAPMAFEKIGLGSQVDQIDSEPLAGDGSDRQWYRLRSRQSSLIMVDHGIHNNESCGEVDAFVGNRLTGLYYLQKINKIDQIKPEEGEEFEGSIEEYFNSRRLMNGSNGNAVYISATKKVHIDELKGLIHKNKAARYKSRLNTRIHAM